MYSDDQIKAFSDYELGQKTAAAKHRYAKAVEEGVLSSVQKKLYDEAAVLIAEADRRAGRKTEEGKKLDQGKWRFSLLPWIAVLEVILVLEFGAKKYAVDNWKKVPEARERYFNATMRHVMSWYQGERNDPETGYNHLAHAVCCLLFLIWFDKQEKE